MDRDLFSFTECQRCEFGASEAHTALNDKLLCIYIALALGCFSFSSCFTPCVRVDIRHGRDQQTEAKTEGTTLEGTDGEVLRLL